MTHEHLQNEDLHLEPEFHHGEQIRLQSSCQLLSQSVERNRANVTIGDEMNKPYSSRLSIHVLPFPMHSRSQGEVSHSAQFVRSFLCCTCICICFVSVVEEVEILHDYVIQGTNFIRDFAAATGSNVFKPFRAVYFDQPCT
jgi:hypothetical protein